MILLQSLLLLLPLLHTSATTTTTESALELLIGDTETFLKHYFDVKPYHMIRDDDENKKTISSLCVFNKIYSYENLKHTSCFY